MRRFRGAEGRGGRQGRTSQRALQCERAEEAEEMPVTASWRCHQICKVLTTITALTGSHTTAMPSDCHALHSQRVPSFVRMPPSHHCVPFSPPPPPPPTVQPNTLTATRCGSIHHCFTVTVLLQRKGLRRLGLVSLSQQVGGGG